MVKPEPFGKWSDSAYIFKIDLTYVYNANINFKCALPMHDIIFFKEFANILKLC